MKNYYSRMKVFFITLVKKPALNKGAIFVVGIIFTIIVESGMQKFLQNYFPEYFENGAQEIVQAQTKNIENITNIVNKLKDGPSSEEVIEAVGKLDLLIVEANKENQRFMSSLERIVEENNELRKRLVTEKGIDAGIDLKLEEARGVTIGNYTIAAEKNGKHFIRRSGIPQVNPNYRINSVRITGSSPNEASQSKILSVGESLNFQKNDSELCTLGFLSERPNGTYNFSLKCKSTGKTTK